MYLVVVTLFWVHSLQDRLNWIMDQLGDGALLGELKEKLRKRKARRQWMRRKKDANEKDLQEMLIRRRRLHEDIDRDRELAQSKLLIEKRVQNQFSYV